MLNINSHQRVAVYFFYDLYGKADGYVYTFLNGLKEIADRVVVVINGSLEEASEAKMREITDEIIIRENTGYDVYAYKAAFEYIGWEELQKYEEVVYCNSTVFGPIYPFKEMFDKMSEQEELDFWGITSHPVLMTADTLNPLGYIPEHIQHYFVVYRKKFTASEDLKLYWDTLPPITSYDETVGLHETVFTRHFSDLGYKWDTYVKYDPEQEGTQYVLMYDPLKAAEKFRSPVIKRKLFFLENIFVTSNSIGEKVTALLGFLEKNALYDTDLIYENIIRCCNQKDFIDNFGFWYVLPENYVVPSSEEHEALSQAAVIMIVTDGNDDLREKLMLKLPEGIKTSVLYADGGDQSSIRHMMDEIREISGQYKYICIWNDRKMPEAMYNIVQSSKREVEECSLLATPEYIQNVIDLFHRNKWLGVLMPHRPETGGDAQGIPSAWGAVYNAVNKLKNEVGLHVPVSRDAYPVSQYGYFWFRSDALLKLLSVQFDYSEWKGTDYQAYTCLVPYLIQNSGFAPGYVTSDSLAAHQFAVLTYYMKTNRHDYANK